MGVIVKFQPVFAFIFILIDLSCKMWYNMKKQVETVLFLYLIAFIGLLFSSLCEGVLSELVKLFSFSVPIAVGTVVAQRVGDEEAHGPEVTLILDIEFAILGRDDRQRLTHRVCNL